MIIKHICKTNNIYKVSGLNLSVNGMNVNISPGTLDIKDKHIEIENTTINFEALSINRTVGIYLVNDANNPIICEEEIEKNMNSVPNLLMTIAFFRIPANCSDLNDTDIDYWFYKEDTK